MLRVLLSGIERLALWVGKVLLLVHLSRCQCWAAVRAVRRVLQALGGKRCRHAASSHGLVGYGTERLGRTVGRVVVLLRVETTATTAIRLEALVAGLGRLAAHVGRLVRLSRHSGAVLQFLR